MSYGMITIVFALGFGVVSNSVAAQGGCTYTPNVPINGHSGTINTTKVEYQAPGSEERTSFNKDAAGEVLKGERIDEARGERSTVDFWTSGSENPVGGTTRGEVLGHVNRAYPSSGEPGMFQPHEWGGPGEPPPHEFGQHNDLQRATSAIDHARSQCP